MEGQPGAIPAVAARTISTYKADDSMVKSALDFNKLSLMIIVNLDLIGLRQETVGTGRYTGRQPVPATVCKS